MKIQINKFRKWMLILTGFVILPLTIWFCTLPDSVSIESMKENYKSNTADWVTSSDNPEFLKMLVFVEDRHFYSRDLPVSFSSLSRAVFHNVLNLAYSQGGSTLQMTLIKNLGLVPREKSIYRKVSEIIYTIKLFGFVDDLERSQVTDLLLNRLDFGRHQVGVGMASKQFFNKSFSQLSPEESLMLITVIRAQNLYGPWKSKDHFAKRFNLLRQLLEEKKVMVFSKGPVSIPQSFLKEIRDYSGYFEEYPGYESESKSTIDNDLQRRLELAYEKAERDVGSVFFGNEEKVPLSTVVMITSIRDNRILAYVGGKDHITEPYPNLIYSPRPIGSLAKGVVLSVLCEKGITLDQVVSDEPVSIGDWQVRNYESKSEGNVTLAWAFASSNNRAFVRMVQQIGFNEVQSRFKELKSNVKVYPSAVLGAIDMTLPEILAMYQILLTGMGYRPEISVPLLRKSPVTLGVRNPELVSNSLKMAMAEAFRVGTGSWICKRTGLEGQVGVKTGTDDRNAWLIAVTNTNLIGIWSGYSDNRPLKGLKGKMTGSSLSGRFLLSILEHCPQLSTGPLLLAGDPLLVVVNRTTGLPDVEGNSESIRILREL